MDNPAIKPAAPEAFSELVCQLRRGRRYRRSSPVIVLPRVNPDRPGRMIRGAPASSVEFARAAQLAGIGGDTFRCHYMQSQINDLLAPRWGVWLGTTACLPRWWHVALFEDWKCLGPAGKPGGLPLLPPDPATVIRQCKLRSGRRSINDNHRDAGLIFGAATAARTASGGVERVCLSGFADDSD